MIPISISGDAAKAGKPRASGDDPRDLANAAYQAE